MSPFQLRLTFTNTLEDFVEAQAPIQPCKRQAAWQNWVILVIFSTLTAIAATVGIDSSPSDRSAQSALHDDILLALLPPVIPTLYLISTLLFPWKSLRPNMHRRVLLGRRVYSSAGFITLALCGALLWANVHWFISPTRGLWIAASIGPSIGLILAMFFLFRSERRYTLAGAWERESTERLPHTVELSERGYFDVTEMTESLYRWPCFSQCRETRKLYVLSLSDGRFLMVPKRAFADDPQQMEFRSRISEAIPNAQLVPRLREGFPIILIEAKPQPAGGQDAVTPPAVRLSNPHATKDAG